MLTLTATATCRACGQLAEGDPAAADKTADKHTTKTGHTTATVTTPAKREEGRRA